MAVSLHHVVIDAHDLTGLARLWSRCSTGPCCPNASGTWSPAGPTMLRLASVSCPAPTTRSSRTVSISISSRAPTPAPPNGTPRSSAHRLFGFASVPPPVGCAARSLVAVDACRGMRSMSERPPQTGWTIDRARPNRECPATRPDRCAIGRTAPGRGCGRRRRHRNRDRTGSIRHPLTLIATWHE